MSLMTKIQEALAANPGVGWNDLVLQRLRAATSSTNGALNDLWMRWLDSQGYTQGSLGDRRAAYWRANSTPLAERNAFYFGYTAFFSATVPGAPTIGTATGGNALAVVAFTAPGSDGGSPIIDYRVTSSSGGLTATGVGSPITITGLTNGQAYTFTVQSRNAIGFSAPSAASNSVTPQAPVVNITTRSVASGGGNGNGVILTRNGEMRPRVNSISGSVYADEWVTDATKSATVGDQFQVQMTGVVGTLAVGSDAANTWYTLDQTRVFELQTTGSFQISIRRLSDQVVVGGPAIITVT